MIKAIAIDDEPPALKLLENYCANVDFLKLERTFVKPTEALKYVKKFPVDLIFLDVQMPGLTGIELYKSLQQETMVIFTTAHSRYALDGFELSAVDFLLKPFTYERFLLAVKKAQDYHNFMHRPDSLTSASIFVRSEYSLVKIKLSDIIYIEGSDDYIKIIQETGNHIIARMTMKAITEKLPAAEFLRVHRSFIIPLSKITHIRNKNIYIGDSEIPIGVSYEQEFNQRFKGE